MKSPTPITLAYCQGVMPTIEFLEWCKEKGHCIGPLEDFLDKDLLPDDPSQLIIIGPHVYNHQGPLEKKHFDLYTKSLRATMRETKKALKGGGK